METAPWSSERSAPARARPADPPGPGNVPVIEVRAAELRDLDAIAEIDAHAWRQVYEGMVADEVLERHSLAERRREWVRLLEDAGDRWSTLVAVGGDGRVEGFCTVATPARDDDAGEGVAEIAATYVRPERWGSGAGTALVARAIGELRRDGWIEATLWVLAVNRRARSFYRRFGFEPDGREDDSRLGAIAVRLRAALDGVIIRPLARSDEAELRRIRAMPEVARWWDAPEDEFPWTDEPDSRRFAIEVEGAVAGMIQYAEEDDPKYRHASIDLFVDPALHNRGVGTEAVRRISRELIEGRGHHRITIDPAAANRAAIRTYEKVGFRPVGVMRRYERDAGAEGWHDGLLMELVVGEDGVAS